MTETRLWAVLCRCIHHRLARAGRNSETMFRANGVQAVSVQRADTRGAHADREDGDGAGWLAMTAGLICVAGMVAGRSGQYWKSPGHHRGLGTTDGRELMRVCSYATKMACDAQPLRVRPL